MSHIVTPVNSYTFLHRLTSTKSSSEINSPVHNSSLPSSSSTFISQNDQLGEIH